MAKRFRTQGVYQDARVSMILGLYTMNNKLYVGNLSWGTRENELQEYFAQFGTVTDTFVATEKMSGRSKGFGFVTMSSDEEASEAAQKANGADLDGRPLKVDVARPMEERPAREPRSNGGSRGGYSSNRGGSSSNRGGFNRDRAGSGGNRGGNSRGGSRW